jgi:hypothetical protein
LVHACVCAWARGLPVQRGPSSQTDTVIEMAMLKAGQECVWGVSLVVVLTEVATALLLRFCWGLWGGGLIISVHACIWGWARWPPVERGHLAGETSVNGMTVRSAVTSECGA